ncbi:Hypothetical predicted protein [Pelobates cultripes]|uniref:Uncharacterized protein n=2 Tax=Pelobates cultripes TaxID=61616 RepID=A0AAD1WCV4_PELCU|nr:Hypothetical predicted protein [Pelobates cultripes]
MYRLQQAGSLKDSVHLQHLTTHVPENSRRHQDLSSTPSKYQCSPVFASLPIPQWTHQDAFTSSGRCTPVQEEAENEEESHYNVEIHTESIRHIDLPIPYSGNLRKVSAEPTAASGSEKSRKRKERFDAQKKTELPESQGSEEVITSDPNEHVMDSFWKEQIMPTHAKSRTTYYGGSFHGRRRYQYGRQDLIKEHYEKEAPLPEGGFLPPIPQSVGPEAKDSNTKVQEPLKLPPILEETVRVPRRKRRLCATEPPKELLVIPLLVQFENQKINKEGKVKQGEAAKEEVLSQGNREEKHVVPSLNNDVQIPVEEGRFNALQMEIDWNVDPQTDGDILPMPEAPPVGSLPPINGKKGAGNQSSMANLKASNANSGNTTLPSKTMPTGIIRGSIPEELKECCKGSSVGSLIMSPNGEIVCLSILGTTRETDIPVRFDFIPELDEEDRSPLESTGQDNEQWPYNQQNSEQATGGSNTPSLQPSTNSQEEEESTPEYNETVSDETQESSQILTVPAPPEDDANSKLQLSSVKSRRRIKDKSAVKSGEREIRSPEQVQKTMPDIVVIPSGDAIAPLETDFSNTEDFTTTTEEEESIPPETLLRSTLSPERYSPGNELDQSSSVKELETHRVSPETVPPSDNQPEESTPTDTLPSKGIENLSHEKKDTNTDTPSTKDAIPRKLSLDESEFNGQVLPKNHEQSEAAQDDKTAAPPSASAEYDKKQEEVNVKGPKKQQTKKQKTSEGVQPIGKSLEIENRVPSGTKEKPTLIQTNEEQDVKINTSDIGLTENQPTTKKEEIAVLQDIASSTKKETSKTKGKRKHKSEKIQKLNKTSAEVINKSKQGGASQQGKAAFVVGQPKEKKIDGGAYSPNKTSREVQRQDTVHETHDMIQQEKEEITEEVEIERDDSDEDSFSVGSQERKSTSMSYNEVHSGTEEDTMPKVSSHEAEQPVDKPVNDFLEVPSTQTHIHEYATSENSGGTSASLQKRRSSRVLELSEKAERRRIEIEKKRKEKEEQLRLEKEQQERMEKMRLELEQEQQRRSEENRQKKQQQEEEKKRLEQEAIRRKQLEQQALERARQQQEEYRKKLQEIQRRKQQEELERIELERQRQRDKELMEAEERMRMLEMAADEREEYKRMKQEKEEQQRREAEERRLRAEEETKAVMQEARRQAQLLAKQTAELEQQLQFSRGLLQESLGMDQTQAISRPWVFSYFEFLELLGLPLPVKEEEE